VDYLLIPDTDYKDLANAAAIVSRLPTRRHTFTPDRRLTLHLLRLAAPLVEKRAEPGLIPVQK
jgi:hypothetical protein